MFSILLSIIFFWIPVLTNRKNSCLWIAFFLRYSLCSFVTAKSCSDFVTDYLEETLLLEANDDLLAFLSASLESLPSDTNFLFAYCSSFESSFILSWESLVFWLSIRRLRASSRSRFSSMVIMLEVCRLKELCLCFKLSLFLTTSSGLYFLVRA